MKHASLKATLALAAGLSASTAAGSTLTTTNAECNLDIASLTTSTASFVNLSCTDGQSGTSIVSDSLGRAVTVQTNSETGDNILTGFVVAAAPNRDSNALYVDLHSSMGGQTFALTELDAAILHIRDTDLETLTVLGYNAAGDTVASQDFSLTTGIYETLGMSQDFTDLSSFGVLVERGGTGSNINIVALSGATLQFGNIAPVPIPAVGAGGLALTVGGMVAYGRRQKRKKAAAASNQNTAGAGALTMNQLG